MRFFNVAIRHLIILLSLFLFGCSNLGIKSKEEQKTAEETQDVPVSGEAEEGGEIEFVLIPNPYQAGTVPEAAQRDYQNIKQLMADKKWNDALAQLDLMVEQYPQLSGPYVNLGIVYQQLNNLEKAEKALQFAIEKNKQNFDAYTQLGVLYRQAGRFDEAESIYQNALVIWPHHLASVKNLAILYDLYMGRLEEALTYYELSLKIAGGEDRQLKGWIADLNRRLKTR